MTVDAAAGAMTDEPLVSLLLLAYRQEDVIAEAIAGALAQTGPPIEIVISDDASDDDTWPSIERAVAGYAGPHRLMLNRNRRNLGIGAHIDRLVRLSHGELLVIAAGDDVSLPHRCERLAAAWLAEGRRPDLLSSSLIDLDASGGRHGTIVPSDLAMYRDAADWIVRPPHVVGAAQAWTRRLYDRFGPLPAGTVAEDRLMVLRAILAGGAHTLREPLVLYRRGGVSHRRRALRADAVVERLRQNSRHALVELPQMLADAALAGQRDAVEPALLRELARESFIRDLFTARSTAARVRHVRAACALPLAWRLRLLAYAGCPSLLAPFFWLKRRLTTDRSPGRKLI